MLRRCRRADFRRRATAAALRIYAAERYAWAELLERRFAIDVLAGPDCGSRLRLIAAIRDPAVVERILRHLDLPVDAPRAAPARVTGLLPGLDSPADRVTE